MKKRIISTALPVRAVSGSVGIKFGNLGLGLVASAALARVLGPQDFGKYAFALIVVQLLGLPLNSGLRILLTREVAKLHQSLEWATLRRVIKRALLIVGWSSLIFIATGVTLFKIGIIASIRPEDATDLIALLLFPLLGLLAVSSGALNGLRKVIYAQAPDMILRPLGLSVGIGVVYIAGVHSWQTPQAAMAIHVASSLVATAVALAILYRYIPTKLASAEREGSIEPWLPSLISLTFVAGFSVLQNNMDILMLGLLSSDEAVGLYRVASQGAGVITFASLAINVAIAPHIAQLFAANSISELQNMAAKSGLCATLLALPLVLTYTIAGHWILRLAFGNDFSVGAPILSILSWSQLIGVAIGPVGLLANMSGNERDTLSASIIAVALNFALNIPLIPTYGAQGAAFATGFSLLAWNMLLAWRCYQRTGLIAFRWW